MAPDGPRSWPFLAVSMCFLEELRSSVQPWAVYWAMSLASKELVNSVSQIVLIIRNTSFLCAMDALYKMLVLLASPLSSVN